MTILANKGLIRWGDWTRALSSGTGGSVIADYHEREPGDEVPDAEYDDPVAELVDQSIAAMSADMSLTMLALKAKYISKRSNYEASLLCRISDRAYRTIAREGQIWVAGYLTAIYMRANCPRELKDFFAEISKGQRRLSNGLIQRRSADIG